ncbi:hypothetical protein [Bradyrhizobium sp. LMTR 3]|uniref:hypothetical protein n=1 Tax=Bradyrhizobium sp. LMTR 3 TaxID=189873 RepID=UPI0011470250|nr:hypothetical protein [Bradyrhizobium sp. LMTR 3]
MPVFVAKVTEESGDLLLPVTVSAQDAQTAEKLVRDLPHVDATAKVEVRELQGNLKKVFGAQAEGTAVVRIDWTWRGDQPEKNPF